MTPSGVVLPAYGHGSLADVVPAAACALGAGPAAGFTDVIGLPSTRRCVVLLIDGLGHRLLCEHADEAPYLCSLPQRTVTVGVPSTTATSLTSLGTGLPPGQHGVVGFTSRIPGSDRLLNALSWDAAKVDPVEWQPLPTAFARTAAAGVVTTVVSKREFIGSGLTLASQRGAEFVPGDTAGERLAVAAALSQQVGSLTYVYDGDLDWTGHRNGCQSAAWRQQLAVVDAFAQRLREVMPPDTMLLVTADHGMVDVPLSDRVEVDDEPELLDGVAVVAGEARLRHLYCRAGAVDDVLAQWRARLGDKSLVHSREEALAEGWFGPVRAEVVPRIGDVLVACLAPVAVTSRKRFKLETRLIGLHGSLTADEMVVPLLIDASGY